jgi:hypothetical protein
MSEFGAPPAGTVPWQLMHLAASTAATSHGMPVAALAVEGSSPPGAMQPPVIESQTNPGEH